jgi:hypothetical protein
VNGNQTRAVSTDPALLSAAWSSLSLDRAWLRPHDWYTPEVEVVTEAITAGLNPDHALEALGAARAEAGVGLTEALDDLRCLAELTPGRLDPWSATKALARGWDDAAARGTMPAPVLDPATDLATLPYLAVRLREIYDAAHGAGGFVPTTHCLIVIDTATACPDPWSRFHRGIVLGQVMREVFTDGSSVVSLGDHSGAALALVARTRSLGTVVRRLRARLNEVMADLQEEGAVRHPVRVWVEQLPAGYDQATALLADLAR